MSEAPPRQIVTFAGRVETSPNWKHSRPRRASGILLNRSASSSAGKRQTHSAHSLIPSGGAVPGCVRAIGWRRGEKVFIRSQ